MKPKKVCCRRKARGTHAKEEYARVNNELLQRIERLFTSGIIMLSAVIALWSLTVNFLAAYLVDGEDSLYFLVGVGIFLVLLFGLPTLIVYPCSVKLHDNIRAVASLSAYTKIFFGLPSLLEKGVFEEQKTCLWEMLHCEAALPQTRFFSVEYTVIAFLAPGFSLICGALFLCMLWGEVVAWIIFLLLLLAYVVFLVFIAFRVRRRANIQKHARNYMIMYTYEYLERAIALKQIKPEDKENYLKEQEHLFRRDQFVQNALRQNWKTLESDKDKTIGKWLKRPIYPSSFDIFKQEQIPIVCHLRRLGIKGDITEVLKMYRGEPFDKNDDTYKEILDLSEEYCKKYNKLCARSGKKTGKKEEMRKKKLLDLLFPDHGTLHGVGAGIRVVIGMVELGNNCYINANVKFNPDVHVKTGDYFFCAPNVTFGSENDFDSVKSIEIGDDVWVCADVQIQGNVKIGSRSVIGLGSVVKSESALEGNTIYSGNPAHAVSMIENRGQAMCNREHTEPLDKFEEDFVKKLNDLKLNGDPSQLLYMLRGKKYNAWDDLAIKVSDYTKNLCARYSKANILKRRMMRKSLFPGKHKHCRIGKNVVLECIGSVRLGNHVKIGHNVTLMGNINIGDGCKIGNNVSIIAIGHELYHENRHVNDGCLINTSGSVEICAGVTIEKGCKIGPNNIIRTNTDSYTVLNNERCFQIGEVEKGSS